MKHVLLIIIAGVLFGTISCRNRTSEATVATEKTEEHHDEQDGTIVTLTNEQIKAVGIELGSLEQKNITATVKVNGTLEVPAQNKAVVTSLYSGMIKTIHVHPGAAVRKGQVLATVVNTELTGLQQQLISVNASLRLAELEERRQRELVTGNAAPLKNLQRAQAELINLRAQRTALQKQLSAIGVSTSGISSGNISTSFAIRAPISGSISDIDAQIGSNVDPSTPLAHIVNNSQLHLDLYVYEKDLPAIHSGQIIHFTLTNNPGKEYDAKIFSVGTAFANETKAVPVHAEVIGEKTGLIEGMGVTALISIGNQTAPAVPNEAIVSSNGRHFIFIRTIKKQELHPHEEGEGHEERTDDKGGHREQDGVAFERIEVARGASELGQTVITPISSLPAGVQVVTKGAFFLLAKMTNTGGHEH